MDYRNDEYQDKKFIIPFKIYSLSSFSFSKQPTKELSSFRNRIEHKCAQISPP